MALHQLALDDADLCELMFSGVFRPHAALDSSRSTMSFCSSLALMNCSQAEPIMRSEK
jgi:hypothetical protein